MNKKRTLAALMLMASVAGFAQSAPKQEESKAEVHGMFRANYDTDVDDGKSRFLIQNARVSVGGKLSQQLRYYIRMDFCSKGNVSLTDAYGAYTPAKGLEMQLGYTKVPFTLKATRAPEKYMFVNASTIFTLANLRAAGLKVVYTEPVSKLLFQGGVFNSTPVGQQTLMQPGLTAAARVSMPLSIGITPEVGFMSRKVGAYGMRYNQYAACMSARFGDLYMEAEYLRRFYCASEEHPSYAFDIQADYGWDVKTELAERVSVQARYDGASDYTNGEVPIAALKRYTVGVTAARKYGKCYAAFRLNYEHIDSPDGLVVKDNVISAGMVMAF